MPSRSEDSIGVVRCFAGSAPLTTDRALPPLGSGTLAKLFDVVGLLFLPPHWSVVNRLSDVEPEPGELQTEELVVDNDVLVKAFYLGPGAELDSHDHPDSVNVFHVLRGTVTVVQDGEEEALDAPGVVHHDRGVAHGARNDTDEVAVFTASLCPLP